MRVSLQTRCVEVGSNNESYISRILEFVEISLLDSWQDNAPDLPHTRSTANEKGGAVCVTSSSVESE